MATDFITDGIIDPPLECDPAPTPRELYARAWYALRDAFNSHSCGVTCEEMAQPALTHDTASFCVDFSIDRHNYPSDHDAITDLADALLAASVAVRKVNE